MIDLEQIRRQIGADRLILVGHSYGAVLAGHYLALHPEHVARMVVISPGALDPADGSGNRATAGLDVSSRIGVYAAALAPRALLVMHGTDDGVIGYHHGVALHAAARTAKQWLPVPAGRHIDGLTRTDVRATVLQVLQRAVA